MKVLPAIAVAALACLLVAAAPADLEAPAAPGRLSRVVGFFSLGSGVPDDVAAAIDDWEAERHEAALASLARAASTPGLERHRDEIHLVRGLVLDDLDWRDEAAAAYAGVLETSPPSPYHPLALLRLVESRRALGDRDAVIEAYRRHFAKPWAEKSVRAQAIRNVLEAYGDLRTPGDPTSAEERALLVSPTRLADLVREAKERPAERIAYLAGLELAAAGHLREAVDAFDRVGLSSPYHRFAAFSAAQALYAMDDLDGARRKLRRVALLPTRRLAEAALAERGRLLESQLLFAAGDVDGALGVAANGGEGPFAFAGQLLRGEIRLETGAPSLAVAYLRELEPPDRDEGLDARHALDLGAAYRALGDVAAAAVVLRGASDRLGEARATLQGDGEIAEAARLRAEAEAAVTFELARDAARRHRTAEGIRRVVAAKGPLNLGKIVRVLFTSHENTVLGEPVYDTKRLGESDPVGPYRPKRPDAVWRTYLASEERPAIEAAIRRRRVLEARDGRWLARDTVLGGVAARATWRRKRIASPIVDGKAPSDALAARARAELDGVIDRKLRLVVRASAESFRRLQYEVDLALSRAIANEGTATREAR